jgi:hypothetical protein
VAHNISGLKRGGSPGRPKGVPNKVTVEAKAAWAALAGHELRKTEKEHGP